MAFRRRQQHPTGATVVEAIQYLASACDGGYAQDGHGFSHDHVDTGHWLVNNPDSWGPTERQQALFLVRYYQRQLSEAGFRPQEILANRRPSRIRQHKLARLVDGWVHDPTGVHQWRYWNGARWTHHVAQTQPAQTHA